MSINLKIENKIAVACFDNINQANSFSLTEAQDLQAIIHQCKEQKVKGLVFYAAPSRNFCSGGALSDYAQMSSKDQGLEVNQQIKNILEELSRLPFVTICCVDGNCLGGGVELIAAFDQVFSTPQSVFSLWQRRIGLSFGWGGGARLLDRLGRQKLRQLSLESRLITSYEALQLNLIDRILPEPLLLLKAFEEVEYSAKWPVGPVEGLKGFSAEQEQELFSSLWMQEEHRKVLDKWKK